MDIQRSSCSEASAEEPDAGACGEQSTWSPAGFLKKAAAFFARRGVRVECVQTDNGFEFTNRLHNKNSSVTTLFEKTAAELGIRNKYIRPYTPRHNGKVERSHREDQKPFYNTHSFYSPADFDAQLAVHQNRTNPRPMRPLFWLSPRQFLSKLLSNMFDNPTINHIGL